MAMGGVLLLGLFNFEALFTCTKVQPGQRDFLNTTKENSSENLTEKCIKMELCITSTGNMYAKQELAIPSTTSPRFMLKKVVDDGTLIEEQENILAKKEAKSSMDANRYFLIHFLWCSCRTHWIELFGG